MVFEGYDTVMFGDVDASGIGHFAHQVRFVERAEFLFMKQINLDPREWFLKNYLFPRVKLEVEYLSPLHFADEMRMDVQVGHLGNTSYSLTVKIINLTTQMTAMSCRVVIVVVDPDTQRPVPLPSPLRAALTPYLQSAE